MSKSDRHKGVNKYGEEGVNVEVVNTLGDRSDGNKWQLLTHLCT